MERLQEALKRAREQRAAGETRRRPQPAADENSLPPAEASTTTPRARPRSVEEAWANVEEFTPAPRIMRKNRIVSYFGGLESSAFDMLRTKVLQQANAKTARRLLLTSPSPGCVKTTTATNLAFSLGRQGDLRTLLIDIDLRRPTLGSVLGLNKPHQFSDVLANKADPEDHMVRIGENLLVATNAMPAEKPSELLQSRAAREAIVEIEKRYRPDLVLFDALPVLTSDDTIGFLEFCDAAIIVAAAEQNSIDEVDVTEAEVASVAPVIGVVLNKCRYTGANYDYY